jgi:hypothetical protein
MALGSSAITTKANKPPLHRVSCITLKRLIPYIACLITYAHAQVETFDLTYTPQVQEEAPSSTDDKKPVSFKNLNHAVLTLEKRLKTLKVKKTKAKAKGSDRILVSDPQLNEAENIRESIQQSSFGKKFQTSGLGSPPKAKALAAAQLNLLGNSLIIEEEKRTPSHLITDPSKKAAP